MPVYKDHSIKKRESWYYENLFIRKKDTKKEALLEELMQKQRRDRKDTNCSKEYPSKNQKLL